VTEHGAQALDYSPDGEYLAFSYMNFDGGSIDIYVLEIATGSTRSLTGEGNDCFPAWSPDGEWIAFDSNRESDMGMWHRLWLIRLDGSDIKLVRQPSSYTGLMRDPDWSPDGQRLVFTDAMDELYIVGLDGGGFRQLTDNKYLRHGFRNPSWSPDGGRIAWECNSWSGEYQIWVINVDGSSPVRLVRGGMEPSWSPDGCFIVYADAREYGLRVIEVGGVSE